MNVLSENKPSTLRILQCLNWNLNDIKADASLIREHGFNAV